MTSFNPIFFLTGSLDRKEAMLLDINMILVFELFRFCLSQGSVAFCKQYGHVVDSFILIEEIERRAMLFGFVASINVQSGSEEWEQQKTDNQKYTRVETDSSPVIVLEEDCLNSKDLSNSLIGRVKDVGSLSNLKKVLCNEGRGRLGFGWLIKASHAFRTLLIATKWGELLDVDEHDEMSFHSKRICIHTKICSNICENFKIVFKGKVHWIRAKEVRLDTEFSARRERYDITEQEFICMVNSRTWFNIDGEDNGAYEVKNSRAWYADYRNNSKGYVTNFKEELRILDELIDKGNGSDEIVNNRLEILGKLQQVNKAQASEVAQKAKIKWSMIGSLMYLTASRPDIMFVVCACSRESSFDLVAYSDSDYGGANLDRKYTIGEAEYVAAANCYGQPLDEAWGIVGLPNGIRLLVEEGGREKVLGITELGETGYSFGRLAKMALDGYMSHYTRQRVKKVIMLIGYKYTFLEQSGYRRGTIDKTLFIKKEKKDIMLVQVYVDDIIFGSTKKSWCDEFEALMKNSQDKYVAKILKKFDFMSVKHASTPIETHKPLVKDEEATEVDVHLYRSMIGSLMYLTASRPDIMYLKGNPKLGLWYPRESSFDLVAYSDSDYGGANLDRKSTTGGCQFLGHRLISWQCKKQTIVATSTTEAEYVAAANCYGQVLWIQNQMLDYGFNFMNTRIYIDNESTICIVKNPVFHSKTKHIEIRHHFIRDAYEKKLIQVSKIHTDNNVADLLTKVFDVSRFKFLVVTIRMINQ
ncbi:hypothetical protein Tco_0422683 [Tanacetum coccineum]